MVYSLSDVFDTGEGTFAITAFGTGRLLVNSLCLKCTTWCSDCTCLVLFGVVGVTSNSRPAMIRHDDNKLKEIEKGKPVGCFCVCVCVR